MAHTFEGKTIRIFHNGDFSGDVTIVSKTSADSGVEFQVDFEDLKDFIAEYVRSELIAFTEQATSNQLLLGGVDL